MPFEDQVVTKFIADTEDMLSGLRAIQQESTKVVNALKQVPNSANAAFSKSSQGAEVMRSRMVAVARSASDLDTLLREIDRHAGQLTTSFRRASLAIQTGRHAFDFLSSAIDRSSMMMWRFSIAAIPLRNLAFQTGAMATAFGALGYKMASAAAWLQVTQRQFVSLYESQGKSREEAEQMINWLRAQAPKLPATLQEITEVARILTTQGLDVKALLLPLSDLTVGLNQAGVNIVSATRAMVDATHGEFRRLRNTFNISREDVEKYAQGAFDAQGRVLDRNKVVMGVVAAIAEKYPQATRAAMGGLALAVSNLQDALWQFFASAGKTIVPVLTAMIDRASAFLQWLTKLTESPFWSKAIGWSVIAGTLGAAFVTAAATVSYLALQFAGLAASMMTFFRMYSDKHKTMIVMEQRAKEIAEAVGEVRARMLMKELPLLELRLQLLSAMFDQEEQLARVGTLRAAGRPTGEAEAAAAAASQRVSLLSSRVQQMSDVLRMPQLEEQLAQVTAMAREKREIAAALRAEQQAAANLVRFEKERRMLVQEIKAGERLIAAAKKVQAEAAARAMAPGLEEAAMEVRRYAIAELNARKVAEAVMGAEMTPLDKAKEARERYRLNLEILSTSRQIQRTKEIEAQDAIARQQMKQFEESVAASKARLAAIEQEIAASQALLRTNQSAAQLDRQAIAAERELAALENERVGLENRLKAARAANVGELVREDALLKSQRQTLAELYALERARRAQRALGEEMARGLPRPGTPLIPPGMGLSAPWLEPLPKWERPAQAARAAGRAGLLDPSVLGRMLVSPLEKARDALVAFGKYAKQTGAALWQYIAPGLQTLGSTLLQMGLWSLAFTAFTLITRKAVDAMNALGRQLEETANSAKALAAWLRGVTTVPVPEWTKEAVASAEEALDAWLKARERGRGRIGEVLAKELGPGGAFELQRAARLLLEKPQIFEERFPKLPAPSVWTPGPPGAPSYEAEVSKHAMREARIAELRQKVAELAEKTLTYDELRTLQLDRELADLIAEVAIETRSAEIAKTTAATQKEVMEQNKAAREIAKSDGKLTEEQRKAIVESADSAKIYAGILEDQRGTLTEQVESYDQQKETMQSALKSGRDFKDVYAELSQDLANDEATLREIEAIDRNLNAITRGTEETRAKELETLRKQLQIRRAHLDLEISIYRLEQMRQFLPALQAAGVGQLPTITAAQVGELLTQVEKLKATGNIPEAWNKYAEVVRLVLAQEDALIAAREEEAKLIEDEIARENKMAELAAKHVERESLRYRYARATIMAAPGLSEEQRRASLLEAEAEHNLNLAKIEKERKDHLAAAQKEYEARVRENAERMSELQREEWERRKQLWDEEQSRLDSALALYQKMYDLQLIGEAQLRAAQMTRANQIRAEARWYRAWSSEWIAAWSKYYDIVAAMGKETADQFRDLIGQVVGAPQEMIRKFVSPAAIQQRFGALEGMGIQFAGRRTEEKVIRVKFENLPPELVPLIKDIFKTQIQPGLVQTLEISMRGY